MLGSVCDLLRDLALEEMQELLRGFLEDVGPVLVFLTRHSQLQQSVETQITALFDDITQPKPRILLYDLLVEASSKTQSLAFAKFLKHIFCEKVAASAINELPTLIEALLEREDYIALITHFN